MKVTMQYTVELNEVPLRINKIVEECTAQLTTISKIATAVDCMNPEKFTSQVDFLRKKLFIVDNKLEECFSLMEGYQQALKQAAPLEDSAKDPGEDLTATFEEAHRKMEEMSHLASAAQDSVEAKHE